MGGGGGGKRMHDVLPAGHAGWGVQQGGHMGGRSCYVLPSGHVRWRGGGYSEGENWGSPGWGYSGGIGCDILPPGHVRWGVQRGGRTGDHQGREAWRDPVSGYRSDRRWLMYLNCFGAALPFLFKTMQTKEDLIKCTLLHWGWGNN